VEIPPPYSRRFQPCGRSLRRGDVIRARLRRHAEEPGVSASIMTTGKLPADQFVPPNDRDALVSAILDAPNHPRAQSVATTESAWNEIADLHLAAYRAARG
jgi:hypothetical protein